MKLTEADVYSISGEKKGKIKLPSQFSEALRMDVIKRAVLAQQGNKRQAYGTDPLAGQRSSAKNKSGRHKYGTWANLGMAGLPRIRKKSGHLTGTVRLIPGATKGRRAHPPKAEKIWSQKVNIKEKRLAIRSAIAATALKEVVERRGHALGEIKSFPLVIEDSLEGIKSTSAAEEALKKMGLSEDLCRAAEKKVRAGKGTRRGRKYKTKKGPLIVIAEDKGIKKALNNVMGVDVSRVKDLNAEILAPGAHPGRLTVWTKSAIEALEKEKLFC